MILGIAYTRLYQSGFINLLVKIQFFKKRFYQTFRIGRIVYSKIRRVAQRISLSTQNPCKNRMKSTHPQVLCLFRSYSACYTFLHLSRSLICKRKCQDGPRFITIVQQIRYLIRKYPRFSGTSSGYHQRRSVIVKYGSTLAFVEFIQIIGHLLYKCMIDKSIENISCKFTQKERDLLYSINN